MSARPIDLDTARSNAGDDEVLRELAQLFLEECPAQRARLRAAVRAGDDRALEMTAHALKGALRVFAAAEAVEAAFALERCAAESGAGAAAAEIAALETQLDRLAPALEELARG